MILNILLGLAIALLLVCAFALLFRPDADAKNDPYEFRDEPDDYDR